jgi:transcriptional regulator with XRE-family HTH domain
MPAAAPPIPEALAAQLAALGERLRLHRKQLGVSTVAAAEAAGMSRVTWHRIERGEPSVSMGAYLSAAAALGLEWALFDPLERQRAQARAQAQKPLPARIRLADYPQLRRLAWQMPATTELTPEAALDLYERNWRHVDRAAMTQPERELVQQLAETLGGGRLLV